MGIQYNMHSSLIPFKSNRRDAIQLHAGKAPKKRNQNIDKSGWIKYILYKIDASILLSTINLDSSHLHQIFLVFC